MRIVFRESVAIGSIFGIFGPFAGISQDVSAGPIELGLIANDVLIVVPLPEATGKPGPPA